MRRWDALLERYVAQLRTRGLSAETIASRRSELVRFGNWLKSSRPRVALDEVNADRIVRYIRGRGAFRARSTVAGAVSHLRCMGEFLVEEGVWKTNPLRWMRGPKIDPRGQIPRRLGKSELQALWGAAEKHRDEHARYRTLCILAILYGTGLRRGELERLTLADWDSGHGVLKIDGRKVGRQRHVPVGEGVWRCIEAYLPRRHNRLEAAGHLDQEALLVNKIGGPVTAHKISLMLKRLAKGAGIECPTMHQFRHSCASDLIEAGVGIPAVQRILGHAHVSSTLRYTQFSDPERAAAIRRHPINDFLAPTEGRRQAS